MENFKNGGLANINNFEELYENYGPLRISGNIFSKYNLFNSENFKKNFIILEIFNRQHLIIKTDDIQYLFPKLVDTNGNEIEEKKKERIDLNKVNNIIKKISNRLEVDPKFKDRREEGYSVKWFIKNKLINNTFLTIDMFIHSEILINYPNIKYKYNSRIYPIDKTIVFKVYIPNEYITK